MKRSGRVALATAISALALSGCASVPDGLVTADANDASYAQWIDAPQSGVPARWGGTIRGAFAIDDLRCLVVDASPLDRHASPRSSGEPLGGFAACHPELDVTSFATGQRVTVRGVVRAPDIRLDAADGPLPAVAIDHVQVWNGHDIRAGRRYDALGRPIHSAGTSAMQLRGDRREPFKAAVRLHQITQFERD